MNLKKALHPFYIPLLLLIITSILLPSCRKEETPFEFPKVPYEPPPPPATGSDTVISVTAILNSDSFSALGRALTPTAEGLEFSFLTLNGDQLFVALGADTPGTYEMKRSVSAHTAVYYVKDATETRSYTSRATDEAGGTFTLTSIDTEHHRIKGKFRFLLTSRTYPGTYDFKEGVFDILYNFMEATLDGNKVTASEQAPSNYNQGTAVTPFLDNISFTFADQSKFSISAGKYEGLKEYECTVAYTDASGKTFHATGVTMKLIRYNYGQFIQAEIGQATFSAGDGTKIHMNEGRFVQGNTK